MDMRLFGIVGVIAVLAVASIFWGEHFLRGESVDDVGTSTVSRMTDTEPGFEPVGDVPVEGVDEAGLLGRDIPVSELAQRTDLPPIPEPLREDGRTNWGVYWLPLTAAEKIVYGEPLPVFSPPRVGIQVGHFKREEAPEELAQLRANSGARVQGITEAGVMYEIAIRLKSLLEAEGVVVDVLPVTIPVGYQASAFISLHADGSDDTKVRGYKIATTRTDFSGRSNELRDALDEAYGQGTRLPEDDTITFRMTGYYAFNWRRYEHAVDPRTPVAIVETGFLTNPTDRQFLTQNPDQVAEALAQGLLSFLKNTGGE